MELRDEKPRLRVSILWKYRRYLRESLLIHKLRRRVHVADFSDFPLVIATAHALKLIEATLFRREEPYPLHFLRNFVVSEMKNRAFESGSPGLHLRVNLSHWEQEWQNVYKFHIFRCSQGVRLGSPLANETATRDSVRHALEARLTEHEERQAKPVLLCRVTSRLPR